jgi:hypothetical protein
MQSVLRSYKTVPPFKQHKREIKYGMKLRPAIIEIGKERKESTKEKQMKRKTNEREKEKEEKKLL